MIPCCKDCRNFDTEDTSTFVYCPDKKTDGKAAFATLTTEHSRPCSNFRPFAKPGEVQN